ncbi:MAG: type II secretion system protein [Phycisphaerales bacterium]|nr:type II secretion system protein [Phycisphaerales bacterium]
MQCARAMTLLEVLLAISIATMLLGAIGKFAWDIGIARTKLSERATEASCAEAVFSAIERAMETAVVEDDHHASGIVGSESSLRVRSSALSAPMQGQQDAAPSEFASMHVQCVNGRIALDLGRGAAQLDAPVRAFRIRYLLRDGWKDAFDARTDGGFPVAIEASIWFEKQGSDASVGPIAREADRRRLFRTLDAPVIDPRAVLEAREGAPALEAEVERE